MSEEKRPMFKKSDRQQLESDTISNAIGTQVYTDGDHRRIHITYMLMKEK